MSNTKAVVAIIGLAASTAALAAGQTTTRISVSSSGAQLAQESRVGPLSADGRYVSFSTAASGVVAADVNAVFDVFVVDRVAGSYDWISVGLGGAPGDGDSVAMDMTPDARFVVFQSVSSNLVAGDLNGDLDVFVRDRQLGVTTRESVDAAGAEGNGSSINGSISADGRYVAFNSIAGTLVAGDTNNKYDAFVRDRQTGQVTRVSVATGGTQSNFSTYTARISRDGRFVAFDSQASNLVALDANGGVFDVFVHELATGATELASVDSSGAQFAGGSSLYSRISGDGRFVVFTRFSVGQRGVFVRDRVTGQTTWFDPTLGSTCWVPTAALLSMTPDARFIALPSSCPLLVAGDTNYAMDVFVYDRVTSAWSRVGGATDGTQGNGHANAAQLSDDGRFLAFESASTNLVASDTNARDDVFLRDREQAFFRDVDADAFGDAAISTIDVSAPLGFVDNGNDCDDTNAAIHPGAADFCNGVDDDCDLLVDEGAPFCTPTSVAGICSATMIVSGTPSVSASSGFLLHVQHLPANVSALVFYGTSAFAPPFQHPGQKCIASPVQRLPVTNSGGASGCIGHVQYDWLAYVSSHPSALGHPLSVGQALFAQGWYRDPLISVPTRFSEAVEFRMCP